ncbi:MAG: hypothetical protein KBH93_13450 [Anaerolineae bacterium]|nr:hypothetical protein [Anaerolineae bacterium]
MNDTNDKQDKAKYGLALAHKLIMKGELTNDERTWLVVAAIGQSEALQMPEFAGHAVTLLLAAGGLVSDSALLLTGGGEMIRLSDIADALQEEDGHE